MKKILLIVAIFALNTVNAQWKTSFYVDDFGEPTKDSYEYFSTLGTFSNSATQNSKAKYTFIRSGDAITINVYEYERSLATSIEGTFETVKLRKPNKEVVLVKKAFFTKSGKLYFSKKSYTELNEAIQTSGDYIMIFDKTGNYSNSNYKIKFTIE